MFATWNPQKFLHEQLIDLPTSRISCSHCTLRNPNSHFSTMLSIHDSDYFCYARIKWTASITVQLNHITVTWTVLYRDVLLTPELLPSDTQHWGRVCLPARQCASTSRSWHSRASALWDTPVHQSWHVTSQQSWPKPGLLLQLGHDAEACMPSTNPRYGRVAAAACWDTGWLSVQRGGRCN